MYTLLTQECFPGAQLQPPSAQQAKGLKGLVAASRTWVRCAVLCCAVLCCAVLCCAVLGSCKMLTQQNSRKMHDSSL